MTHVQRQVEESHERPASESDTGFRDDRQIQSVHLSISGWCTSAARCRTAQYGCGPWLDVEYFTAPDAPQHTDPVPKRHGGIRQLSLKQAAALLGVDKETVGKGLQQGVFPWGYGVKTSANRWRYIINADRFSQIEGVEIQEGESA